jgi:hypothetical protein
LIGNVPFVFSLEVRFFLPKDELTLTDIISITSGNMATLDVFGTVNRVYLSRTDAKMFLQNTDQIDDPDDEDLIYYDLKITLLPHQILMFPVELEDNIVVDPEMQIFTNTQLQYGCALYRKNSK